MSSQQRPLPFPFACYLDVGRVHFLAPDTDKPTALRFLAESTATASAVRLPEEFIHAIFERERVSSTGIGRGIAIPHARLASVEEFVITVGISRVGIEFAAKDDGPVHVVIMFASSEEQRSEHLRMLAAITARLKDDGVYRRLLAADEPDMVVDILAGG